MKRFKKKMLQKTKIIGEKIMREEKKMWTITQVFLFTKH